VGCGSCLSQASHHAPSCHKEGLFKNGFYKIERRDWGFPLSALPSSDSACFPIGQLVVLEFLSSGAASLAVRDAQKAWGFHGEEGSELQCSQPGQQSQLFPHLQGASVGAPKLKTLTAHADCELCVGTVNT
jgi:hypothetical protein